MNMHYCRYQNTLDAMRQLREDFGFPDELSEDEARARKKLITLMEDLLCELEEEEDEDAEDGEIL